MLKKETIWRYILDEVLKDQTKIFTQKNIANMFNISTSTVFGALKAPRKLAAVEVTGRFFRVKNFEKLLLLWATHRNLEGDIIFSTRVEKSAQQIEGIMPGSVIFAACSAYRLKYKEAPAEYDAVYVYADDLAEIEKRFPKKKGLPNLLVLKPDQHLKSFGNITPDVQTFVDLWSIPQWYAKDFLDAIRKKIL